MVLRRAYPFCSRTILSNHIYVLAMGRGGIAVQEPKEELVDVSDFVFDNTIPRELRAAALIGEIKNPYRFRVGDIGVELEFPEDAPTFSGGL